MLAEASGPALRGQVTDEEVGLGADRFFDLSVDLQAVASSRDGLWRRVNPAFTRTLGWEPKDLVGQPFFDIVHPDDLARSSHAAEAIAAGTPLVNFEHRVRCQDGTYKWIAWTTAPDLTTGLMYCVGRDMTERRTMDGALRESEARFRLMADAVPQIVWIVDAEGRNEFFNRRWFDYTGVPQEPTTAAKVTTDYIHPDDQAATGTEFEQARRTGHTFRVEHRIRSATSEYRWFLVRGEPYRDPVTGKIVRWYGSSVDIHARKLAEEALRESEEQLRLATEASEVGLWDLDPQADELFWPPRVKAMFGISPDQRVSMADFYAGLHPDDRQATTEAFAAALDPEQRALYDVEYRTIGKEDGRLRWVAAKGRGVFDEKGHCTRVIGTALDITARKAAEEALRELNATLEARVAEQAAERDRVWRMSRDLLAVMGFDGYLKAINPAWERTLGLDTATLLARPFGEQVHPDDHTPAVEVVERLRRGETVERFEDRLRHADGSWRWIAWTLVPEGEVFYAVGRDVTEEKRRAEVLRLYENIIQSDRFPICAYDTDMRVTAFNTAHADEFFRILGHRQEVGDLFPDLFPPEQAPIVRAFTERALRGETFTIAGEFGDPDHEKPAWESDYAPVRDEAGHIIGAFHHARDVSPRLRAEEELRAAQDALRQSQKMEAVGQLTGGVAHDFNNLLTIIRSSTSLLRRPDLADARRQVYMDAISDTVDRAAKLTSQLLAFARRQALKPEVFDAAERVRSLEGMLGTMLGERIRLATKDAAEPCWVEADIGQFETALINMAVNARDAIDGEGTLTVRADRLPAGLPGAPGGPLVAVSLTDTGSGIAPELLTQIFEPFFTTKEVGKGTGLGLSQVYGFAKQSGGNVAVDSKRGAGTTFTLYLPQVEPSLAEPADEERVEVSLDGGQGRHVLVVEDNAEVGTFSTQLLQDLGYDTTWVTSGTEALARLAETMEPFDIVFTDVVMPGMSGVELGEEIRRRYPGLPVILTSGYSHTLAEKGRHGFDLLRKPYTVEELARVLHDVSSDIPLRAHGTFEAT